jgi:hypothetical protein
VPSNPTNPKALEPTLHTSATSARTLPTEISLNVRANTKGNSCSDNSCGRGTGHRQNSFQILFIGPGVHVQHPQYEGHKNNIKLYNFFYLLSCIDVKFCFQS